MFYAGQGAAQVGGGEDDGGAADAGADGDFLRDEDIGIGEGAQRLGQAEGGDGSAGVACEAQDFAFAGVAGLVIVKEFLESFFVQSGPAC